MDISTSDTFQVNLTHQGKSNIVNVSQSTSGLELHKKTLTTVFGIVHDESVGESGSSTEMLKILFKGKRILPEADAFPFEGLAAKKKPPKIMVVATNISAIQELATKRSDPTIRGFDQEKTTVEKRAAAEASQKYWADVIAQDKEYKFVRKKACTDHSFGHRSTEKTPHAFKAMELLEKLATDPGIIAIMKERELVVGTLGEMDPIDDRIMQNAESHGGRLLGYNTNRGLRIDLKLRTDDLSGFLPYPEIVSTLIHELSHNWVGDHNLLFWTNYAQMKAEYLCTHAKLRNSALVVRGKKTAELAGLNEASLDNVFTLIMNELVREMAQHGLHPNAIAAPIRQRIQELETETAVQREQGYRLGGPSTSGNPIVGGANSARELALAAAERRAREQNEKEKKNGGNTNR